MLCEFQTYSKVIQLYIHTYLFFQILVPYKLLQNIVYSSQCYIVESLLVISFIYSSVYKLTPDS